MTKTTQLKPSHTALQEPPAPSNTLPLPSPRTVPRFPIQSGQSLGSNPGDSAPGQVTPLTHIRPPNSPVLSQDQSGRTLSPNLSLEPEAVPPTREADPAGLPSPMSLPVPQDTPIVTTVEDDDPSTSVSSNGSGRDPDARHVSETVRTPFGPTPSPSVTPSTDGIPPSILRQAQAMESTLGATHFSLDSRSRQSRASRTGLDPDASMSWELPFTRTPCPSSTRRPDPTPSVGPDPFLGLSDRSVSPIPRFVQTVTSPLQEPPLTPKTQGNHGDHGGDDSDGSNDTSGPPSLRTRPPPSDSSSSSES